MFDRVLNTPLSFHQDHLTFVLLCRSKRRIITRHASAVLSPKKLLSNQINELHSKIDVLNAELTSIIKTSSGIKVNLRNLEIQNTSSEILERRRKQLQECQMRKENITKKLRLLDTEIKRKEKEMEGL